MTRLLTLGLLASFAAAVSGCAEMQQLNSKVQGTKSETPVYTVFYDQSDRLKELIAAQDFEGAAQLYAREEPFFRGHPKHSAVVDAAAAGLNDSWHERLNSALRNCRDNAWPAERERWAALRTAIAACEATLADYRDIPLFAGGRASRPATELARIMRDLIARIETDAPVLLSKEDLLSGRNFFADYPVKISLRTEIAQKLLAAFDPNVPGVEGDVLQIARVYGDYGEEIKAELVREMTEILAAQKAKLPASAMFDLYKRAAAHGVAPAVLPIDVAIAVLPVLSTPFDAKVNKDLPVRWNETTLTQLAASGADYWVAVSMRQAKAANKVLGSSREESRFLAGYRTVPNPDYAAALSNMDFAYNTFAEARRDQRFARDSWESLGASLGAISARKRFDEAAAVVRATPATIQRPIYTKYSYDLATLDSTKQMEIQVLIGSGTGRPAELVTYLFRETKQFKVAYGAHNADADGVLSRYSREKEVDAWGQAEVLLALSQILADGTWKKSTQSWTELMSALEAPPKAEVAAVAVARGTAAASQARGRDRRFDPVVVIQAGSGLGAGFFVAPNYVLTNAHVVEGMKFVQVKTYSGERGSGTVQAKDLRRDLALIKVEQSGIPARLARGEVTIGVTVDVVGHPGGLSFSLTRGIVSQVRAMPPRIGGGLVSYVQLDAPISPGNSGGPVYDNGEVVGVATFKYVPKGAENLNFAIHRDEIASFLREQGLVQ